MNGMHTASKIQTTSVRDTGNPPLEPITEIRQPVLGAATVKGPSKRRSDIVDEDQIRQALKKFRIQGGLVRKLPPQVAPMRISVGPHHAEFDYLFEAVGLNFI